MHHVEILQRESRNLGIADQVRFLLEVSDAVKSDLLSAADIFVSVTDTLEESFGLTPIEAMACGTPSGIGLERIPRYGCSWLDRLPRPNLLDKVRFGSGQNGNGIWLAS